MAIYKMTEWQEASGYWACGDCSDLVNDSNHWLHPAKILNMKPDIYIKWVVENYNPVIWYNKDYTQVFFSWEKQSDMRKFKNKINKISRDSNYMI